MLSIKHNASASIQVQDGKDTNRCVTIWHMTDLLFPNIYVEVNENWFVVPNISGLRKEQFNM